MKSLTTMMIRSATNSDKLKRCCWQQFNKTLKSNRTENHYQHRYYHNSLVNNSTSTPNNNDNVNNESKRVRKRIRGRPESLKSLQLVETFIKRNVFQRINSRKSKSQSVLNNILSTVQNSTSTPSSNNSTSGTGTNNQGNTIVTKITSLQKDIHSKVLPDFILQRQVSFNDKKKHTPLVMDHRWWAWNIFIACWPALFIAFICEWYQEEMIEFYKQQQLDNQNRIFGGIDDEADSDGNLNGTNHDDTITMNQNDNSDFMDLDGILLKVTRAFESVQEATLTILGMQSQNDDSTVTTSPSLPPPSIISTPSVSKKIQITNDVEHEQEEPKPPKQEQEPNEKLKHHILLENNEQSTTQLLSTLLSRIESLEQKLELEQNQRQEREKEQEKENRLKKQYQLKRLNQSGIQNRIDNQLLQQWASNGIIPKTTTTNVNNASNNSMNNENDENDTMNQYNPFHYWDVSKLENVQKDVIQKIHDVLDVIQQQMNNSNNVGNNHNMMKEDHTQTHADNNNSSSAVVVTNEIISQSLQPQSLPPDENQSTQDNNNNMSDEKNHNTTNNHDNIENTTEKSMKPLGQRLKNWIFRPKST